MGFPGGSVVKNLPAMQETGMGGSIPGLGRYPLEEGMATHSNILVWEIPWTEAPGRALVHGGQTRLSNQVSMHAQHIHKS